MCCRNIIKTKWNERMSRREIESRKEDMKWNEHDVTVRLCGGWLYSTLDSDLAVFLFKHLRKHRHSRFTIKRFLLIGAVGICEEGTLVVHEEVTSLHEVVKYKFLVDEWQR